MANDFRGQDNLHIGLRNNNPLNLRTPSSGYWLGQIGENQNFAVFPDISWGLRAYLVNFKSSIKKHNTTTLRSYINRYAPPTENITSAYLNSVVKDTGISADETIPTDQDSVSSILRAQLDVELGKEQSRLITDDDIAQAFYLLDNPSQSFFSAAAIYATANPVKTTGLVIGFFASMALIGFATIKIIQHRKAQ